VFFQSRIFVGHEVCSSAYAELESKLKDSQSIQNDNLALAGLMFLSLFMTSASQDLQRVDVEILPPHNFVPGSDAKVGDRLSKTAPRS
jgi:hypothetical protein